MFNLLWLIPMLPLAGFLILVMIGKRLSPRGTAVVAVGSVALAGLVTLIVAGALIEQPLQHAIRLSLYTWIPVDGINAGITLYLDALSLVMTGVVTFIGFLIMLYSAQFMRHYEDYNRFFAYMSLFIGSMLILVLADNLLLLYMGWEGVGLCSYLLIGFWYKESANARAAMKAFIVTRVGDTSLLIGILLLLFTFGTLDIQHIAQQAPLAGTAVCTIAAALLLGGAVGKSAQLPLQVWLPDAMAGPTPVSALIHAATMVTAGVYLIARMHVLFAMAPAVQTAVTVIGAATLLLAGISALMQHDIKRILAYSTMSQIGYMFLALGVGAWSAAIFHFMIHAFFKSLLFLAAGAAILALDEEHNIFRMGGWRRTLPVSFWGFVIGASSMAALPLVTAGFYSKDYILWEVWSSPAGGTLLWSIGVLGAFITALYSFRVVFTASVAAAHTTVQHCPMRYMNITIIMLAVFSLIAGFMQLPDTLGNVKIFSQFTQRALPVQWPHHADVKFETMLDGVASFFSISGIAAAYIFYGRKQIISVEAPIVLSAGRFALQGWGFDFVYDRLFAVPYRRFAMINRSDFINSFYVAIASGAAMLHRWLAWFQNGRLRWYAACIAVAAIIFIAIMVLI